MYQIERGKIMAKGTTEWGRIHGKFLQWKQGNLKKKHEATHIKI